MELIPKGDYYVWYCDWCDSTNYTIRTLMEHDDFACAACHKKFPAIEDSSAAFSRLPVTENGGSNLSL